VESRIADRVNHVGGTTPDAVPTRSRPVRWLLAGVGVLCVGLGGLGVVVPGLPTTVFLIAAAWCFARSCPWLEERLIRVPLFKPFLRYLDGDARMPRRAVVTTLAVMWAAIGTSTLLLLAGAEPRPVVAGLVIAAGAVGTVFVLRLRDDGSADAAEETDIRI
jgi:uncharacterized membrane protein YbaN (DUF454 family)